MSYTFFIAVVGNVVVVEAVISNVVVVGVVVIVIAIVIVVDLFSPFVCAATSRYSLKSILLSIKALDKPDHFFYSV